MKLEDLLETIDMLQNDIDSVSEEQGINCKDIITQLDAVYGELASLFTKK